MDKIPRLNEQVYLTNVHMPFVRTHRLLKLHSGIVPFVAFNDGRGYPTTRHPPRGRICTEDATSIGPMPSHRMTINQCYDTTVALPSHVHLLCHQS